MYRLIACCIFFHVGRGHYLDIFPPGEPVLPVLHMGYMWKQYFLQFPDYQLSDYRLTGTDDIPPDRRFYLLLFRPWRLFSHILDWGDAFYLWTTWGTCGRSISYNSRNIS